MKTTTLNTNSLGNEDFPELTSNELTSVQGGAGAAVPSTNPFAFTLADVTTSRDDDSDGTQARKSKAATATAN